ncbi:hypothetical protein C0J52_05254 [Blattella germanica]|nr:hypothetical protein C0J52_05254 [Blattella germanica]
MNRPTIADQEDLVKESLFKFVRKHIPSAQLSSIDEIVLSYVVSILEDLGTEASVEEAFDVEGFCEMMAAYFPEFSTIHHAAVCQWMFELEATLIKRHVDHPPHRMLTPYCKNMYNKDDQSLLSCRS